MTHVTKTSSPDLISEPAPRLVVDLAKIQGNFKRLQAIAPGAEVGAVVKANAYGLGATEVVPALADAGCSTFYVAHTSEGREAREALGGREADIYVFNGFWPSELAALREAKLFPVINDLFQLSELRALAPDLPFALHIDTGMSRLGLGQDETDQLLADPGLVDGLQLRQLMSHLACADLPEHPLNARQLERFKTVRRAFPQTAATLSNSAGALMGAEYHFDVLRPGLALYGGAPTPGAHFDVSVEIEAPILQIRTLAPGDTVGYGASFTAQKPMRLATVAAGYADGILRACGEGGMARLGDTRIPIIGRVSMDLITVDLTRIERDVRPGEHVCFLGSELEHLAGHAHAISYELLVRLGLRFNRVYRR